MEKLIQLLLDFVLLNYIIRVYNNIFNPQKIMGKYNYT